MAVHKLTDRMVRQSRTPGIYADGGGLYLQVTTGRSGDACRSWFVRLRFPGGRTRDMGLGVVGLVPLAAARRQVLSGPAFRHIVAGQGGLAHS